MSNVIRLPIVTKTDTETNNRYDTISPECHVKNFKNEYVSVSRLQRYESCPLSFKLHYVVKADRSVEEFNNPAAFGVVLHDTLERLYQWVINEEFQGILPLDIATGFYRDAWRESRLSGLELFNEGLRLIRSYLSLYPQVDHLDILGVEVEFDINIEEFRVKGYIDRIDKVDDETIRIIDYKSNRLLYTLEELDSNLQMSVYALAAKQKYPWVKHLEFEFHMLRHDRQMPTKRTMEQLKDAAAYVVEMSRRTEKDPEYPAVLGSNCVYCEYTSRCETFKVASDAKRIEVAIDSYSMEALFADRMRVASLAKLFYKRQKQIDDVIRARIEHSETGTLEVNGYSARLFSWNKETIYDLSRSVALLERITRLPAVEIYQQVASIDKGRLETFLGVVEAMTSRSKALVLKAELDLLAEKIPGSPRLDVRAPKGLAKAQQALPAIPVEDNGKLLSDLEASVKTPLLPPAKKPRAKVEPKPRVPRVREPKIVDVDLD